MRFLSTLLLIVASLLLVVSVLFVAANKFLQGDSAKTQVAEVIREFLPTLSLTFGAARFSYSLGGVLLSITDLTIAKEGITVVAPRTNIWLDGSEPKIVLNAPTISINKDAVTAGGGDGLSPTGNFIIIANNARVHFAALSLSAADVVLHHTDNRWRVNLTEETATQRLFFSADTDDAWRGRAYAEIIDGPTDADTPLAWSSLNATLWINLADSVGLVAGGVWRPREYDEIALSFAGTLNLHDERTADAQHWTARDGRWRLRHNGVTINLTTTISGDGGDIQQVNVGAQLSPLPLTAVAQHLSPKNKAVLQDIGTPAQIPDMTIAVSLNGQWAGDTWTVPITRLSIYDGLIAVATTLSIGGNAATLTEIRGNGTIAAIPLANIADYLPSGEMREWFLSEVLSGTITAAQFSLHSDGDFSSAQTTAQVTAAFIDGVINIDDGWPMATALAGTLAIINDDIKINGSGVFGQLTADRVIARIPQVNAERATLYLDINGAPMDIKEHWQTARQVPPISQKINDTLQLFRTTQGRAELLLTIAVPLATPAKSTAEGHIQFKHVVIETKELPPLVGINGTADFNNNGVSGTMVGKLGEEFIDAPLLTIAFADTEFSVRGQASAKTLLSVAALSSLPIEGKADFHLQRAATITIFTASLSSLAIDIPSPFTKSAGAAAAISVVLVDDTTLVDYTTASITMQLWLSTLGVDLAINEQAIAPQKSGFNIHGQAANVAVDDWLDGGDSNIDNITLAAVSLALTDATLLGGLHDRLLIESAFVEGRHSLSINSSAIAGTLTIHDNTIIGNFARIYMGNDDAEEEDNSEDNTSGSNNFFADKTLSVTIGVLQIGEITLGIGEIIGAQSGDDWHLSRLQFTNGDTRLNLAGRVEQENTFLTLNLHAPNLPRLLTILNIPPVIGDGRVSLIGSIAWRGTPTDFDFATLQGRIRLLAQDVRYLDTGLTTGAIKLLSIFSPQSLISLGFTELNKPGIIFNVVEGDIRLENGIASSDSIYMVSDDILMDIHGKTNYVEQQHDLAGRVRPGKQLLEAGSALTLGTGLVAIQPLSLLAGSLFGKVFEKPIAEIGAYNYTVTGTWQEPVYTEIGLIPPADETQTEQQPQPVK